MHDVNRSGARQLVPAGAPLRFFSLLSLAALLALAGCTAHADPAAGAPGVGGELIPREAIRRRPPDRIAELARRFLESVRNARDR